MALCLGNHTAHFKGIRFKHCRLRKQSFRNTRGFGAFFLTFFLLPRFQIKRSLFLWVVGVILAGLITTIHSMALGVSIAFFLKIACWMAAFLVGAGLGRKKQGRRLLPLVFLAGGLALCAAGYAFLMSAGKAISSMGSTFYQSDVFSGYLLLLIPIAASFALFSDDFFHALMYGVTTMIFVICLFLTNSRGAFLVFIMVTIAWGFLVYRKQPKRLAYIAGLFAMAFFAGYFYLLRLGNQSLLQIFWMRVRNPQSWADSSHARFSFWLGGIKIFLMHPWLGSGWDTFGKLFPLTQKHFYWYSKYPHNFYIQTLSDGGILNLITLGGILAASVWCGVKALRVKSSDFPLAAGVFFGVLGGILHLFLDVDSNFLLWSVLFWMMTGLLTSLDPSEENVRPVLTLMLTFAFFIFLGVQGLISISMARDKQAESLASQGHLPEALNKETQAIRFFPLDGAYFEHRAKIELALCDSTSMKKWCLDSRSDLEHALKIDPVRPYYLNELAGLVLKYFNNRKEAKAFLEKSLALDPVNNPLIYVELADLLFEEGNGSQATRLYESVLMRYPQEQVARLSLFRVAQFRVALVLAKVGLAKIALRSNDSAQAGNLLREALSLDPENPQANYFAGLVFLNDHDWEKAKNHFRKVVGDPNLGPQAWKWLALAMLRLREGPQALDAIRKSFESQSRDPDLFALAGEIYDVEGNKQEALKMWQTGLKLEPGSRFFLKKTRKP